MRVMAASRGATAPSCGERKTAWHTCPVFESIQATWASYCSLMLHVIPPNDIRHARASEVRIRLGQLDIILKNLHDAISAIQPDAKEVERANRWGLDNHAAFEEGRITTDEWIAGTSVSFALDPVAYVNAW